MSPNATETAVFCHLILSFHDVDIPNAAVSSPNHACSYILHNHVYTANVIKCNNLLKGSSFFHLSLLFDDVNALNDAVLSPNLACGLYTILHNQQMSPNEPVLLKKQCSLTYALVCLCTCINDALLSANLTCGL